MTLALHLVEAPDTIFRRLEPRAKLLGVLVLLATGASLQHLLPVLALLGLAVGLVVLSRLPWPWYRARLALLLPLLVLMVALLPLILSDGGPALELGFCQLSWYGLVAGLRLAGKAFALVTLVLVLLATTPAASLFHAAQRLGVPTLLLTLLALAYRQVLVLVEELDRLRVALRTRGFRNRAGLHSYRLIGNLAGLLLVRSAERAERVGHALRTRGFHGSYPALGEARLGWGDVATGFLLIALGVGLLGWDRFAP